MYNCVVPRPHAVPFCPAPQITKKTIILDVSAEEQTKQIQELIGLRHNSPRFISGLSAAGWALHSCCGCIGGHHFKSFKVIFIQGITMNLSKPEPRHPTVRTAPFSMQRASMSSHFQQFKEHLFFRQTAKESRNWRFFGSAKCIKPIVQRTTAK